MNLGSLMSIGSPSMPTTSPVPSTGNTGATGFGSVFRSVIASSEFTNSEPSLNGGGQLTQLMADITNAETLEDLASLLVQLKQSGQKLPEVNRQSMKTMDTVEESIVIAQDEEQDKPIIPTKHTEDVLPKISINLQGAIDSELLNKVITDSVRETKKIPDLPNLQKFPSLHQLASVSSANPDKLVETITSALEAVGVTKEQLEQIQATGDTWFVLEVL
ncbi:hypothetical protein CSV79_00710 [Sporosarcina sp. P13]|uniref:hypothetical protein n=1 Tax=Sporosarcina sp. P13 TaxID=2048263 RepID=UPI000C169E8B|nr:hypothetical protein [Sporosarcina sp. P13]PIC65631.1 hypothetical protein CSV79_00710 [Sporosarcina sp. P13]